MFLRLIRYLWESNVPVANAESISAEQEHEQKYPLDQHWSNAYVTQKLRFRESPPRDKWFKWFREGPSGPNALSDHAGFIKLLRRTLPPAAWLRSNLRNTSWSRASGNCESSAGYLGELRDSRASSNRVYGASPPMYQGAHVTFEDRW